MSTETKPGSLLEAAAQQKNWEDTSNGQRLIYGDLEIRVTRARLSYGWEWGLYNQSQVVLQGRWCEWREEAKRQAVDFATKWMVDEVRC